MRKLLKVAAAVIAIVSQGSGTVASAQATGGAHAFTFNGIDGKPMPLAQYRGKVLLVVNTASFCGYTGQYEGLQKLWTAYGKRGLVVIGVPSNDFFQETGSDKEVASFCKGSYGVTFPLTAKSSVTGQSAHPFYAWANGIAGGKGAPKWNFHKYLVSTDGRLVSYFSTSTSPLSAQVTAAIERELGAVATQ